MSDEILKEGIDKIKVKSILESLLFINERPIAVAELSDVIEIERKEVADLLDEMVAERRDSKEGITIVKVAGGYQMCSSPDNEIWVKRMYQQRGKQKLSVAALETLAIIAYKQPITRLEIEMIRGVNVDGVSRKLLDLGLIKPGGRKDVVGKPFLYITTRKFLEYFGLNSLRDLPKLEEFAALVENAGVDSGQTEDGTKTQLFESNKDKADIQPSELTKDVNQKRDPDIDDVISDDDYIEDDVVHIPDEEKSSAEENTQKSDEIEEDREDDDEEDDGEEDDDEEDDDEEDDNKDEDEYSDSGCLRTDTDEDSDVLKS